MNRKFKSFLSMFMSAAIAVSSVSVTASAETEYLEEAIEANEMVVVAAEDAEVTAEDELTVIVEQAAQATTEVKLPTLSAEAEQIHYGAAAATSGECGVTATWQITDNVLVVSGTGDMTDFASQDLAMLSEWWAGNSSTVTEIVIEEGITSIGDYAFYYFDKVNTIHLPTTLKEIGKNAFDSCAAITTVDSNANKLEIIGDTAFRGCSELLDFDIPDSVTYIGNESFYGAAKLTEIIIPANVADNLGDSAFYGCTSATAVTIENGVSKIGNKTFSGCGSLEVLTIPETVTSIGNEAFFNCAKLSRVNGTAQQLTLSKAVTSIGDYAFSGCSAFAALVIDGNAAIGEQAFSSCSGLKSVKISGNNAAAVTTIGNRAFKSCGSLTAVTLEGNVTSLGEEVFVLSGLQKISLPETLKSIGVACFEETRLTSITFPSKLEAIGKEAFNKCTELATVTFTASKGTVLSESAFSGCTALKTLNLQGVSVIGKTAFSGCTALAAVTLPSTLTATTNNYAEQFKGCTALKTVTIQDGAIGIGQKMFDGCSLLTEITIPASTVSNAKAFNNNSYIKKVTINAPTLGAYIFSGATSLSSVSLAENTATIGAYAFQKCTSLTAMDIPEGVTTINSYLFEGCTSLKSVKIGTQIKTIGGNAFDGCTALKGVGTDSATLAAGVKLPETVTSFGASAFRNCSALTSIDIPVSVNSLGTSVFSGCTSIDSLVIPAKVTNIPMSLAEGCTSLAYVKLHDAITVIGQKAFMNCEKLPEIALPANEAFKILNSSTFEGCTKLKTVTGGRNITTINAKAFLNAAALEGYIIPSTVTKIDSEAFSGCSLLDSAIPSGVTAIGTKAFMNCSSLGKTARIILPSEITTINANTFEGCVSMAAPVIPVKVKTIGANAFFGCSSTTFDKISIPDSVTTIGNSAFEGCSNLSTITFALEGCTTIGDRTFANCTKLSAATLPTTELTKVGAYAFENCKALTSITLPTTINQTTNKVKTFTLGIGAFSGCSSLTNVTLSSGITVINNELFLNCYSLGSVELPEAVTSIGDNAFSGCSSIASVTIPGGVTRLGKAAFFNCDALTSVVIPTKVSGFGEQAFADCAELEVVIFLTNAGPATTSTFLQNSPKAEIYCYKTATAIINYAKKNAIKYHATLEGQDGIYVVILKQPEKITGATIGETYKLTTTVASEGKLSYAWYYKAVGDTDWTATNSTEDFYQFTLTKELDGVQIKCEVTVTDPDDATNTATTASDIAIVSTFGVPTVTLGKALTNEVFIKWTEVTNAKYYTVYRADTPGGEKTELAEVKEIGVEGNRVYTDTTVQPNTTYYYFVTAYSEDLDLESGYSDMLKVTTPKLLDKPVIKTITCVDDGVKLTWDAVDTATSYRVYRSEGTTGNAIELKTVGTTYCTDTTAELGKKYFYYVAAYNGKTGVLSERSDAKSITVTLPDLDTPVITSLTQTNEGIVIQWNTVNTATSYKVYRATSITGTKTLLKTVGTLKATDTTVKESGTYYYFIHAYNSKTGKSSVYSNAKSIAVSTMAAPVISSATYASGAVSLAWSSVEGATSYRVFRADSATGTKTQLKTVGTLKCTDDTVAEGKTYYYFIKAYNSKTGELSPFSAAMSVETKAGIAAPTLPAKPFFCLNDIITVKWNAVEGATSYRVFRATSETGERTLLKTTGLLQFTNQPKSGTYYYYVKAYNSKTGALSDYSAPIKVSLITKPVIYTAEFSNGAVNLTWNYVNTATSYRVFRTDKDTGVKTQIKTVSTNKCTDTDVVLGKTYIYTVQAWNNNLKIISASATPKTVACVAQLDVPTITSYTVSNGDVILEWTAVDTATSYRIYRATSPTGAKTLLKTVGTLRGTDTTAEAAKTYYYYIAAYNSKTNALSDYSTVQIVTT